MVLEPTCVSYTRVALREQNIRPASYIFCHMLCGYSSMDMHREITMLWQEIKHILEYEELDMDRDLLDCLILDFLEGGQFSRVMKVLVTCQNIIFIVISGNTGMSSSETCIGI